MKVLCTQGVASKVVLLGTMEGVVVPQIGLRGRLRRAAWHGAGREKRLIDKRTGGLEVEPAACPTVAIEVGAVFPNSPQPKIISGARGEELIKARVVAGEFSSYS